VRITKAQLLYAVLATCLLSLSSLPALREPRDDDYPFSTYPMFASRRKTPTFYKAEGQHAGGRWGSVPAELFGTTEVMQAVMTVQHAARTPRAARSLCNELTQADPGRFEKVRIVQVVYDPVRYFTEGPLPQSRKVLAQCGKSSRGKRPSQKGQRR
jgi:hypothetical protein